jgi:hypothetical protein
MTEKKRNMEQSKRTATSDSAKARQASSGKSPGGDKTPEAPPAAIPVDRLNASNDE